MSVHDLAANLAPKGLRTVSIERCKVLAAYSHHMQLTAFVLKSSILRFL
jgi:hypothetical protein